MWYGQGADICGWAEELNFLLTKSVETLKGIFYIYIYNFVGIL